MDKPAVLGFNVLGSLQMTIDGSPVKLSTPKPRALLAMLIINRNRPVASEALMTAMWEDSPPPKADASLHGYIAELRKTLKDAGLDPKAVLPRVAPGYQLSLADDQCDIGRFQAKQAAGLQAAAEGSFQRAGELLASALNEWKGTVLADLSDYEFARVFGVAVERDRLVTVAAWAEAEIVCDRAHAVLNELEALTVEHPYEEPLWAQLITALYVTDRQAAALEACRRLRKILDDDLGIEPGQRIRELEERILRQEPLDINRAAKIAALDTLTVISQSSAGSIERVTASLRDVGTGRRHHLTSGMTRIGRDDDNDIVLADREISRHHGVIVDTRASYLIVDLHSRNGIHVDGERVKTNAMLTDGALVRIGGYELAFEIRAGRNA